MITHQLRVHKYLPSKLYGFCIDQEGRQVFFYLSSFVSERYGEKFTPPIPGEPVEVTYNPDVDGPKAPRAEKVVRLNPPAHKNGVISGFKVGRGYGFITGDDGDEYYLHRSEVLGGRLPMEGQHVSFVVGCSEEDQRPRACYITIH